jgi:hypothetical protein
MNVSALRAFIDKRAVAHFVDRRVCPLLRTGFVELPYQLYLQDFAAISDAFHAPGETGRRESFVNRVPSFSVLDESSASSEIDEGMMPLCHVGA